MDIGPGIYTDLSNEDYHRHHGSYSKSSLVDFSAFPYNLKFQRANPKTSDVFDLGTACHTAILEIEKWEQSVVVIPPEVLAKNGARIGNAWKEWKAAQDPNKAIITVDQRDQVMRVYESIHKNPGHSKCRQYLTGGYSEVSVFWEELFSKAGEGVDPETGYGYLPSAAYSDPEGKHKLVMKVRPDHVPAESIITDLKTTGVDIWDDEKLERHAHDMHYHWSAALTLRGMTMATGKTYRDYFFVFVQVSRTQPVPHECRVVRATEEFIALGRRQTMEQLQRLAWCDIYDRWPGIPNKVGRLGLPAYVHRKLYQEQPVFAEAA